MSTTSRALLDAAMGTGSPSATRPPGASVTWTHGGVASSGLATALATAPRILGGSNSHVDFTHGIFVAIWVAVALLCITLAVAIAALGTQLVRKEQRRLVQKAVRSEGTYLLPHSPVLAPVMVIIFAIVALATCFVLRDLLWTGTATEVVQRLSLTLPMPLLLYAWLSACANAFAWHLTPLGNSKFQRMLRVRPITLNILTWIPPFIIFGINLALIIMWPIFLNQAKELKAQMKTIEDAGGADGAVLILLILTEKYEKKLRASEYLYQATWAVWALAYGFCWLIYVTYSSLLLALLGRQLKFVSSTMVVTVPQVEAGMTGQEDPSPALEIASSERPASRAASYREAHSYDGRRASRPSIVHSRHGSEGTAGNEDARSRRSYGMGQRWNSSNPLKFMASVGPEMRYISKRELLRKNTRLVALELLAFSVFTIAWWVLSIAKAAMGYRILSNPITGPITVVGELFESSIFGLTVVSLLLSRGINILRNRKEEIAAIQTSGSSQSQSGSAFHHSPSEEKPSSPPDGSSKTEKLPEPASAKQPGTLAVRRGKNLLAIDLGAGTYFVPGSGSGATTPLESPSFAHPHRHGPLLQRLNGEADKRAGFTVGVLKYSPSGDESESSSPETKEPSLPVSPYEFPTLPRRKSSVTFADEVMPLFSGTSGQGYTQGQSLSPAQSPSREHRRAASHPHVSHAPDLESIAASPRLRQTASLEGLQATLESENQRTMRLEDGESRMQ